MKQELKNQWVEALFSGEYKQGQRELETPDGKHCCMGVLAKLLDLSMNLRDTTSAVMLADDEVVYDDAEDYNRSFDHRFVSFTEFGLQEIGLDIGTQGRLMEMNDGGSSFSAIGEWIDRHVPVEEEA